MLPTAMTEHTRTPCPRCENASIKSGARKTRRGAIQKYYCAQCKKYFSASPIPRRRYAPAVILNAISAYNLGNTLAATRRRIARRFKVQVPVSTLHAWLSQFAEICTFIRYRRKFSFSEAEVVISRAFQHRQEYRFAFHRLKTNILCKARFPEMRRYLWYVRAHCPNALFTNAENDRCSKTPVKTALTVERWPPGLSYRWPASAAHTLTTRITLRLIHSKKVASENNFYTLVYAAVRRIPPGRVATYGQIAGLIATPRAARAVGYALHALPADTDVPWQRVVNATGRLTINHEHIPAMEQARLLRAEDVKVEERGNAFWVDLKKCLWRFGPLAGSAKVGYRIL